MVATTIRRDPRRSSCHNSKRENSHDRGRGVGEHVGGDPGEERRDEGRARPDAKARTDGGIGPTAAMPVKQPTMLKAMIELCRPAPGLSEASREVHWARQIPSRSARTRNVDDDSCDTPADDHRPSRSAMSCPSKEDRDFGTEMLAAPDGSIICCVHVIFSSSRPERE